MRSETMTAEQAREQGVLIQAEYLTAKEQAKRTCKRKLRALSKRCPHHWVQYGCKTGYEQCVWCQTIKPPALAAVKGEGK